MDALRRASAALFYTLGTIVLVLFILLKRELIGPWASALLHVLDLPLLLFGMLYGGLSLTGSMTKGSRPTVLHMVVGVILASVFIAFAWMNFGFPFA